MSREDVLRKLEKRLAEGEISEETYREIKARYDAMPTEEREVSEAPEAPEPPEPPEVPPRRRRRRDLPDISAIVEGTVDAVMEDVTRKLEATLGSEEIHMHMEDVGRRIQRAMRHIGPRYEKGRKRVIISAMGTVHPEGPIEEFRCSGAGKVDTDLEARVVRISGACKIEGRCECEDFRASGAAKVESDVKAETFKSSGSTKVQGDLRAREIAVSGAVAVEGSILDAEEVRVGGKLRVGQWVRAASFRARGAVDIGEGLEAEEIRLVLDSRARIPILKGRRITVERSGPRGSLRAKYIEGEKVAVSGTRADRVRGEQVRIGPRSRIDVVESATLEVHETARVGERRAWTGTEGTPEDVSKKANEDEPEE